MGVITNIVEALRRIGGATQQSAIKRQDQYLIGKIVTNRRREVVRSPSGTAESFVATVAPMPEEVRPMNAEELQAIKDNGALIERLFEVFLGCIPVSWGAEQLDAVFSSWARATEQRGYDDEAIVQILGAAFGQLCERTLQMTWVVIVDSNGSAAALRGLKADYRAFPFHAIRKRIRDREEGFLQAIYITLEEAAASDHYASI